MTTPEPLDNAAQIARAWEREQPGVPVGSIGILTRIWQAAKLLTDERRRTLARVSMDAATLDLLSNLRRAGPPYRLSTRELGVRSMITAGAVTQRVDRARDAGLVRRLAAEPGTRTVFVELTEAGHAAVTDAVSRLLTYEQRLVDILEPDEQAELARLLSILLHSLAGRAVARETGGAASRGGPVAQGGAGDGGGAAGHGGAMGRGAGEPGAGRPGAGQSGRDGPDAGQEAGTQ